MTGPRLDDFATGAVYDVQMADASVGFTLDKRAALSDSGREGGSFRLEFVGPSDPVLPQAIYSFANAGNVFDIFIVPVARDANGVRYEAIFY